MEIKASLTVTLDASPALLGALERLTVPGAAAEKTPKSRARAAKKPEPEQVPAAVPKASESAPESAVSNQSVTPAVAASPASAPAESPVQGAVSDQEARKIIMDAVQQYERPEALREKMQAMGYEQVTEMPADVRADFIRWVKENFPDKKQTQA